MNTAEKHGVEPGSYLAELCPILSDWIQVKVIIPTDLIQCL